MDHPNQDPKPTTEPVYQKQKLYIKNLQVGSDIQTYQAELKASLSDFGSIIDFKMLENSKLTRSR